MNTIENKPANCKLTIHGDGNTVKFAAGIKNFNSQITIGLPEYYVSGCVFMVGKNTTAHGVYVMIAEDDTHVSIGEDCMFSDEINIWASDTHAILDSDGNVVNRGRYITIGDRVWIGKRAIILKNTLIASSSIVGFGAVVSGKFDTPGSVIVGNPARTIKTVAGWSRMRPCEYVRKMGKSFVARV